MIKKHENIIFGVYGANLSVPGRKLSGWLNNAEYMAEGETEDLQVLKKDEVLAFLALLYMFLY